MIMNDSACYVYLKHLEYFHGVSYAFFLKYRNSQENVQLSSKSSQMQCTFLSLDATEPDPNLVHIRDEFAFTNNTLFLCCKQESWTEWK